LRLDVALVRGRCWWGAPRVVVRLLAGRGPARPRSSLRRTWWGCTFASASSTRQRGRVVRPDRERTGREQRNFM